MINKRLLVKNLLAHNDENSFYDKKRKLNIGEKEGKAKFLKHICALSNSNPNNNAFIVIGVEDDDEIVGVDFFDDSKIQNLINAYLANPPMVQYENIPFPNLPTGKVVGLVTIRSNGKICSLRKNIWKYYGGSVFFRDGSISMPKVFDIEIKDTNSEIVSKIETHAQNNIELTLDGVIDFLNHRHNEMESHYKVFKETFVVCWAGIPNKVEEKTYYSRVDIELINEQVKLFYSALDEVKIRYSEDAFMITEYVQLGLNNNYKYYALEEVVFNFEENGTYTVDSTLVFEPPQYDKKELHHIYNNNNALLNKLKKELPLSPIDKEDLKNLPATYMLCYLNLFHEALDKLMDAKLYLQKHDEEAYASFKEARRILRKIRYSQG
ncbi:ATP-binding protein [Sungkyunkwania multivorans]|uniref:ATP-binding protein n=1 Tax=Sungkyunkwania multivorans TaxID=1173618 RepID=A0ABW3D2C4_9FLAO